MGCRSAAFWRMEVTDDVGWESPDFDLGVDRYHQGGSLAPTRFPKTFLHKFHNSTSVESLSDGGGEDEA